MPLLCIPQPLTLPGAWESTAKPQTCLLSSEQPGPSPLWRRSHSQNAVWPGLWFLKATLGLHSPKLTPQDGKVSLVREGPLEFCIFLGKVPRLSSEFQVDL